MTMMLLVLMLLLLLMLMTMLTTTMSRFVQSALDRSSEVVLCPMPRQQHVRPLHSNYSNESPPKQQYEIYIAHGGWPRPWRILPLPICSH